MQEGTFGETFGIFIHKKTRLNLNSTGFLRRSEYIIYLL
jgi:hypothetical protein